MPNLFEHCRDEVSSAKSAGCSAHSGCSFRRTRSSGPAGREKRAFAGRSCKFKIQNSKLCSGCSLRSARKFGYELRASAGRRLRPAAVPCRNRKFMIQNSRFKIAFGCAWTYIPVRDAACGAHACSVMNCGPPPPGGCDPHGPTERSKLESSLQPSGGACDVEEQPSARGRLRAAAVPFWNRKFIIQDSKFRITELPIGPRPA